MPSRSSAVPDGDRIQALDDEGQDARLLECRADQPQAWDRVEPVGGVLQQAVLVRRDHGHPDGRHVVDGGAQSNGVGDVPGACLEAAGRSLEHGSLEGHVLDHVAATLPGLRRLQHCLLAVDRADARRREDLVTAEDVEVGIQRLDIDRHVRHGLGPVDEGQGAVPMGGRDHDLRGRDGAEGVRDRREGDQLRAAVEQPLVFLEDDLARVVDRRDAEPGARLGDQLLPRHDVGVVLEVGEHDLVTGSDVLASPALGDEVDALGRAADEDDLARRRSVEEAPDLLAGRLERVGGASASVCAPRCTLEFSCS